MTRLLLAITFAISIMTGPASAETGPRYDILDFADLQGWGGDDHAAALAAFLETCRDLDDPAWPGKPRTRVGSLNCCSALS